MGRHRGKAEAGRTAQLETKGPYDFGRYSSTLTSLVARSITPPPVHIGPWYLPMGKFQDLPGKNHACLRVFFFSFTSAKKDAILRSREDGLSRMT